MKRVMTLCAICLLGAPAQAGVQDCQEAISGFRAARSEVGAAIRAYANCIASSDGHDDCSSEFSTLRSAHDEFEEAVSSYESECS
jgi:hypothetical protein